MHHITEQIRQRVLGKKLRPPLTEQEILEAERRLGFSLPSLLRELYGVIADGGFGPSYGFLPLLTPVPEEKLMNLSNPPIESAVELYDLFRKGDPENPSRIWPEGRSTHSHPIIRDDPYVNQVRESASLEQWLKDWINGRDLWKIPQQ